MKRISLSCLVLGAAVALTLSAAAGARELPGPKAGGGDGRSLERGRYLVKIGGCNDCHTPRYAETAGAVPESGWLTGDKLGWQGPWGTTYPPNLRLYMANVSESEWVRIAHSARFRPPMPWFNLRDMSEPDLRAIYRFVRALGPAGDPAPAYVPPGTAPRGPVIAFPQPPK